MNDDFADYAFTVKALDDENAYKTYVLYFIYLLILSWKNCLVLRYLLKVNSSLVN